MTCGMTSPTPHHTQVPLDLRVGAYARQDIGDYEQKVQNPFNPKLPWYLDECNYLCQYVLAGLEPDRHGAAPYPARGNYGHATVRRSDVGHARCACCMCAVPCFTDHFCMRRSPLFY
jgi:hypothetical protein